MNRWLQIAFCLVATAYAGLSCMAEPHPQNLKVDINNLVLYNYDTFDTSVFGMMGGIVPSMMKTYNYHISIGDIVAVNGDPAKGTLLCTHTMFIESYGRSRWRWASHRRYYSFDDRRLFSRNIDAGWIAGGNDIHSRAIRGCSSSWRSRECDALQHDSYRWNRRVPGRPWPSRPRRTVDGANCLGERKSREPAAKRRRHREHRAATTPGRKEGRSGA